jgi:hypothetical protein
MNFFLRKCSTTLSLEIVNVNSKKKNHGNRRPQPRKLKINVRNEMDTLI